MVIANRVMLDHQTGELTYSLYRDTKEKLHDDCVQLKVRTDVPVRFESDEAYTMMQFSTAVELQIKDADGAHDGGVVGVINDYQDK